MWAYLQKFCCPVCWGFWHPFWTRDQRSDFLGIASIWTPEMFSFSLIKTWRLRSLFVRNAQLVIWKFSSVTHLVIWQGFINERFFLTKLSATFIPCRILCKGIANEHTLFDGKHFSNAQATSSLWAAKHNLSTVVRFDTTSAKWARISLRLAAQRGMPSTTGCQPKLAPFILLECVNKSAADARWGGSDNRELLKHDDHGNQTEQEVVTLRNYWNTMTHGNQMEQEAVTLRNYWNAVTHGNQTEQEVVTLGELQKCRGCGNRTELIQWQRCKLWQRSFRSQSNHHKEFYNCMKYAYSLTLMFTFIST
jgi:hypothetical protein